MTASTQHCRGDESSEYVTREHVSRIFTVPENGLAKVKTCHNVNDLTTLPDGTESWDCTQKRGSTEGPCAETDLTMYKTLRVDGEAPDLMGCKLYTSSNCEDGDQGDSTTWRMLQNNGTTCVQVARKEQMDVQDIKSFDCVSLLAWATYHGPKLITDGDKQTVGNPHLG